MRGARMRVINGQTAKASLTVTKIASCMTEQCSETLYGMTTVHTHFTTEGATEIRRSVEIRDTSVVIEEPATMSLTSRQDPPIDVPQRPATRFANLIGNARVMLGVQMNVSSTKSLLLVNLSKIGIKLPYSTTNIAESLILRTSSPQKVLPHSLPAWVIKSPRLPTTTPPAPQQTVSLRQRTTVPLPQ